MDAYDLMVSQRYAEAIREYRKLLERNPEDWAAVGGLSTCLMAEGAYAEALPWLHRIDEHERASLPGRSNLATWPVAFNKVSCCTTWV
jgi:tetratricopeptide (TPR) repeat protein